MTFNKLLPKAGIFLLLIWALSSCQEEFSTIGSEILGTEIPSGILDDSQTVVAYSKKLNPIQTNRLPLYQLGTYKDPVYGKSDISFLTQLSMESDDPKFGTNPTVDSVFIYIPFFSTSSVVDSVTTYKLDSIYGTAPVKITISESGYFLRDLDPESGFEKIQPYYSNQGPLFTSNLQAELAIVEEFIPSDEGFIFNEGEDNEKKLAPGLRVALPVSYFQQKIVEKEGSSELRNNNNFKNYLRGIYFQVESVNNDGNLILFDATKGYVEINSSFDKEDNPEERENKIFKLKFGDIAVNTFENDPLPQFVQSDLENSNTQIGNENLYLRGGDGIISVVELFGEDSDNNGIPDELELLRSKKWIINEANLIFYVNQDLITGGTSEPDRIIVYDLKNSNVLVDYLIDPTNGALPPEAFTNHLGKLERDSDGKGKYYRLKITNHISNLINKDSTNVSLGVVVSQNVKNRSKQRISENMEPSGRTTIKEIPSSEVLSHKGTILFGPSSINQEKRLKLQIYYTNKE